MRAFSLARPLVAMGNEVTLVASRVEIGLLRLEEEWDGVRIMQMPDIFPEHLRNAGLSPLDLIGRLINSRLEHYDIFHTFDHRPCAAWPALLRPDRSVLFISDWADLWGTEGLASQRKGMANLVLSPFDSYFETFTRRHCDGVTAISQELVRRAEKAGIPAERVLHVGVGSQIDLIKPLEGVAFRPKYGIPLNARVLVYTGFSAHDFSLAEEAFLPLARAHPDVHLLMSGISIRGFEDLVIKDHLEDQVHFLGVIPYEQLGEVLACGDVMLLPYTRSMLNIARFPNRFGDYIAAGRPVLTNAVGELGEVVMKEGIGLATEPDANAYAAGIEELLNNYKLRVEMGQRARQLAEGHYSWHRLAQDVDAFYDRLL